MFVLSFVRLISTHGLLGLELQDNFESVSIMCAKVAAEIEKEIYCACLCFPIDFSLVVSAPFGFVELKSPHRAYACSW